MTIEIEKEQILHIFGVWFPFDDNSLERFTILKSNLFFLDSFTRSLNHNNICIIGDFNCDRGKRSDNSFLNFIKMNGLMDSLNIFKQSNEHTYFNGTYFARLDSILLNQKCLANLRLSQIFTDILNMSDHYPVFCELSFTNFC